MKRSSSSQHNIKKTRLESHKQPKITSFFKTNSQVIDIDNAEEINEIENNIDFEPLNPSFNSPALRSKQTPSFKPIDNLVKDEILAFVNNTLKIDAVGFQLSNFQTEKVDDKFVRSYLPKRPFKDDSSGLQINILGYQQLIKLVSNLHAAFKSSKNRDLDTKCSELFRIYDNPEERWPGYLPTIIRQNIITFTYQALTHAFENVKTVAHPNLDSCHWSLNKFKEGILAFSPFTTRGFIPLRDIGNATQKASVVTPAIISNPPVLVAQLLTQVFVPAEKFVEGQSLVVAIDSRVTFSSPAKKQISETAINMSSRHASSSLAHSLGHSMTNNF